MKLKKKKRKTFALIVHTLAYRYSMEFWGTLAESAEREDVNLVILRGYLDGDFALGQRVLRELVENKRIDAVIIFSVLIQFDRSVEFIKKEYLPLLSDLPVISVGLPIPGTTFVGLNPRSGLRECAIHLHHRGFQKVAIIRAQKGKQDLDERFEWMVEELARQGLKMRPELVFQGSLNLSTGLIAAEYYYNRCRNQFDCIIAPNDECAIGVYDGMLAHGLVAGKDFGLVGYDNIEATSYNPIPITTIHARAYDLAVETFRCAQELVNTRSKTRKDLLIPTRLVIRESTSREDQIMEPEFAPGIRISSGISLLIAMSAKAASGLVDDISSFILKYKSVLISRSEDVRGLDMLRASLEKGVRSVISLGDEKLRLRAYQTLIQMQNYLFTIRLSHELRRDEHTDDEHENAYGFSRQMGLVSGESNYMRHLQYYMTNLRLKDCLVISFGKTTPFYYDSQTSTDPEMFRLRYDTHQLEVLPVHPKKMNAGHLIPKDYFPAHRRFYWIIALLQDNKDSYGLVVVKPGPKEGVIYESIVSSIAIMLRTLRNVKQRDAAETKLKNLMLELEEYNKHLKELSQTDELTGLLNRRGFLSLAEHFIKQARRESKIMTLFFLDLDGLKQINDTYGHKEGDLAISSTALVLKETFRESDIIGRFGGDEFVVFAGNAGRETLSIIISRLKVNLQTMNRKLMKPFLLRMSVGYAFYDPKKETDVDQLIHKADKMLYSVKRKRQKIRKEILHFRLV